MPGGMLLASKGVDSLVNQYGSRVVFQFVLHFVRCDTG